MRRLRGTMRGRLLARQVLLPLFPPMQTATGNPGIPESRLEGLVVQAVKRKAVHPDPASMTRDALQAFLRAAITAVVFKGPRIVIHNLSASEPPFPHL